jgi:hypothetical protein
MMNFLDSGFQNIREHIEGVSFVVDLDSSSNGTTYHSNLKYRWGRDFSNAIRRFDKFIEVWKQSSKKL